MQDVTVNNLTVTHQERRGQTRIDGGLLVRLLVIADVPERPVPHGARHGDDHRGPGEIRDRQTGEGRAAAGRLMGRELVTIARAAAIASVSTRTIYHWIRLGRLEVVRTVGGSPRVDADSLFEPRGSQRRPAGEADGADGADGELR